MGKPSLAECVAVAASNTEFIMQWARLRGVSLPATPIDQMVDDATGRSDAVAAQFIADVKELVYDRV